MKGSNILLNIFSFIVCVSGFTSGTLGIIELGERFILSNLILSLYTFPLSLYSLLYTVSYPSLENHNNSCNRGIVNGVIATITPGLGPYTWVMSLLFMTVSSINFIQWRIEEKQKKNSLPLYQSESSTTLYHN